MRARLMAWGGLMLAVASLVWGLVNGWKIFLALLGFFVGLGVWAKGRELLWRPRNLAQVAERCTKEYGLSVAEAWDLVSRHEADSPEKTWRQIRLERARE